MMKTIIQGGNDKNMVYNVEPVENALNNWDPDTGFYEDYDIENYFNDEILETVYRIIHAMNILLLMICLYQCNYMVKHGSKKITNKYQSKKINVMYYTYLFNRFYSLCMIIFVIYLVNTYEKHICKWYYGCESNENGDLTASAYYYNVYNSECPDLYKLEESYLDHHPQLEVNSCGDEGFECCRIDVVCDGYTKENRSYEAFNSTMNARLRDYRTGYQSIHVTSRGGCGSFDIVSLINTYLYSDQQEFVSLILHIFLIWFNMNMLIIFIVVINKGMDTWIPLPSEPTSESTSESTSEP